jgi:peptidoglycan/LPS O-acetylase OafA/YrhL
MPTLLPPIRLSARSRQTLGEIYDPRRNGLNLLRLLLSAGVIFWHSVPLTGRTVPWWPAHQLLGEFWVDGFFAISGYLILGSWISKPRIGRFLLARVLRIAPGYWACLLVTIVVLAPLGIWLSGSTLPPDYGSSSVQYFLNNFFLRINQYGIAGTPINVPDPGVWNGSLWTLFWEFCCYLGVLGLGVAGLFRRRWTVLAVFAGMLLVAILSSSVVHNYYATRMGRFGLMFAAGALVYRYRHRIPVSGPLIAGAGAVILLSALLPNYRLVAALPIAYLLLCVGALIKRKSLGLHNDISYGAYVYAFPVQQILAGTALVALPSVAFGLLSAALTAPLAIASWFLIEKPGKNLAHRWRRAPSGPASVLPVSEAPSPTPSS